MAGRVVVFGELVPWEHLLASGLEIVGFRELDPASSTAPSPVRRYLEPGFASDFAMAMEALVAPGPTIDHVLVTGSGEDLFRVFTYLRELHERDVAGIPPPFLLDVVPPSSSRDVAISSRLDEYAAWLVDRGIHVDLAVGALEYRRRRARVVEWYRHRHAGTVLAGAGWATDPLAEVDEPRRAAHRRMQRAVVLGAWVAPAPVLDALAAHGFHVIDEAVPSTPRRWWSLLADDVDPSTRLAGTTIHAESTPPSQIAEDAAQVLRAVRPDLVLVVERDDDELTAWDIPALLAVPDIADARVIRISFATGVPSTDEIAELGRALASGSEVLV
jgi:hypothetical protein